ncbi:MAG: class I SAM-dependent methyltransferase [Bacilli bacterium]|jgi:16S rRNA (guanine1207-N2)-methyltransferase|nr:class I SAM-dependent methyltransferase [Acholeplasmataceae bacterium]
MSKQYFENNPNLRKNEHKITLYYKQYLIDLTSDAGVFSKNTVDYGTNALLKSLVIAPHVKHILDVGCGYGPIGIAIAKDNPDALVDMIDVNERALELAKRNLVHNNITNANVFLSYAFQNVTKMYDLIVTNPPIRAGKKVVHEIFEGAFDHLNDKGELWVVIRKAQGAPSALEKIKTLFGKVNIVNRDKGYYIIQAIKNL